jgi:hypothetical protein
MVFHVCISYLSLYHPLMYFISIMIDCLISFPLWDTLVLALPPLYYYKYQASLAIEWQVESLVFYQFNHVLLYFLPGRQFPLTLSLLHST